MVLLSVSVVTSQNSFQQNITTPDENGNENTSITEDHTVFAEYVTATTCHLCPPASIALQNLNQSSQEFSYVTLVFDANKNAQNRGWFGYKTVAVPTVYFDGGYLNFVGKAETINATRDEYQHLIEESNARQTIKDIDLQTTATWNGDAEISVQIMITNNEPLPYIGFLKTYITEITSRWNDYSGEPYHHAFLDFAINRPIVLLPQQTKTITTQWDGKTDHNGHRFPDLMQNNTMITSAVFHIMPHLETGYTTPQFTQQYIGFYADQADSCTPE